MTPNRSGLALTDGGVGSELARFAIESVPYYRERYAGRVENLDAFDVLPKDAVLGQEQRFLADGRSLDTLLFNATSGTTGTPLRRYYDVSEAARVALPLWRARRWYGITDPRMPSCRFFSDEHDNGPVLLQANVLSLSVRDLSDAAFAEYHAALHSHQPLWFQAVPSVTGRFSRWMLKQGLRGPESLRLIELNSESTLATDRRDIEAAFPGARLADHYGSKETWCVSYQCPHGSRHVMADSLDVEVLTGGHLAAEGRGSLVVTNRHFRSMLLIRYLLGDHVSISRESCACGRPGPLLDAVEGRTGQYAVGDRGESVYETYFDIGIRQVIGRWPGSVLRYQFVQNGARLTAVIEPGPSWSDQASAALHAYLRPVFQDSDIHITTGAVADVPGKKFRNIISDRVG